MSGAYFSCLFFYFATVIFTKALDSGIDPNSVLISSSSLEVDNQHLMVHEFNISDEFLDFYELFVSGKFSSKDLDCSAHSSFKGSRRKDLTFNITKEILDLFETYKSNKRKCIGMTNLCLRKCCEKGQAIDLSTNECHASNISDEISFEAYDYDSKIQSTYKYSLTTFHTLFYGMECYGDTKYAYEYIVFQFDTFTLIDFEKISKTRPAYDGPGVAYDSNSFCLENFVYDNSLQFQGALVCIPRGISRNFYYYDVFWELVTYFSAKRYKKFSIITLVFVGCAICFLLITFLVYATIPELRDNPGKNFMCYAASLMTTYALYSVSPLINGNPLNAVCEILGFIVKIFYFAVYFWLNVICIGVWRTFCSFHVKEHRKRKTSKFLISSCYAWGSPVIISLMIHYSPKLFYDETETLKLEFCVLDFSKTTLGLYIKAAVVGTLLFLNLVLYLCASIKIFIDKNKLKVLANKRDQWTLYLKLFITTGMFWIFEVIIGRHTKVIIGLSSFNEVRSFDAIKRSFDEPMWLQILKVLHHPLQAICIFWIFVFSTKARPLVKQKLGDRYQRILRTLSTSKRNNTLSDGPCSNTSKSNETQESEFVSIDRLTKKPVDAVCEIHQ